MTYRAYQRVTLLMLLFVVLMGTLPHRSSARTSTANSGATTSTTNAAGQLQPENNVFDAGSTPLDPSTYPTNYNFVQARQALAASSYPTNYNFASGDLSGWTPSNASRAQVVNDANSVDGAYLHLNGYGQSIVSSAFVVPTDAQSLRFDYTTWSMRSANENAPLYVDVLSGSNFITATQVVAAPGTYNQGWQQGAVDLQTFRGQTVKLRFRIHGDTGINGQVRLDNVTLHTEVPGWTLSDAMRVQVANDANSVNGAYLRLNGTGQWATTIAFQVPLNVQSVRFDYATWTPRNPDEQSPVFVEILSGNKFAVRSHVGTVQGSQNQGWQQGTVNVNAFRGRTIKLRFRINEYTALNSQMRVDNLAFINDAIAPPAGYDYHLSSYLQINSTNQWALSSPITVVTSTTHVYFDYVAWTARNGTEQSRLFVEVLSGANFTTTTLIRTALGSAVQGWQEGAEANLQAFQGQTIKLRFRTDSDTNRNGHAWINQIVVGNRQAVTTPASDVAASSSACQVYSVVAGQTATSEGNPTIFTTPSEPYIVRFHQRNVRIQGGGYLQFTAGDTTWYAGTDGDALGGNLPQGIEGQFRIIAPADPQHMIYAEVCQFDEWQSLMSFRPDPDLQDALAARSRLSDRPAYVHRLEKGVGDINLDYYPVVITQFPLKPGSTTQRYSAEEFLEFVRTNINTFARDDTENPVSNFSPYSIRYPQYIPAESNIDDNTAWANAPRGALMSILLNATRSNWYDPPHQYGSVFTARHTLAAGDAHWLFSSAYTPGDGTHPVSGNRQFGILQTAQNEWVFYTMAADRKTDAFYEVAGGEAVFAGGHNLWTNLQRRLVAHIRAAANGGSEASARIPGSEEDGPWDSARYDWSAICQTYWRPTVAWTSDNTTTCE